MFDCVSKSPTFQSCPEEARYSKNGLWYKPFSVFSQKLGTGTVLDANPQIQGYGWQLPHPVNMLTNKLCGLRVAAGGCD